MQFLEKYTSHFIERVVCERELETEQNSNILTPSLLAITAFLFRSPGLLNWGPLLGAVFSTASFLHLSDLQTAQSGAWGLPLLGAGFLYRILTPTSLVFKLTDFLSSQSYIIVQSPPSSCGRHKLHSFNPSIVKATLCYSSTGCTCDLHRCISYFDSPAGS